MSALEDPIGGMLNELAALPTGMTNEEAELYLATGITPARMLLPGEVVDVITPASDLGDAADARPRLTADEVDAVLDTVRAGAAPDVRALTAGLNPRTGAMIALIPTRIDADRLAVEDAEPSEHLHVTLYYLGHAEDFTTNQRIELVRGVMELLDGAPAVLGEAFSVSFFNPPGTERRDGQVREPCVVLTVGGSEVEDVKLLVDVAVEDLEDPVIEQHVPWIPHITIAYTSDPDLDDFTDLTGPVTFDRVRVAFGPEVHDIPLRTVESLEPDAPATAEGGGDHGTYSTAVV